MYARACACDVMRALASRAARDACDVPVYIRLRARIQPRMKEGTCARTRYACAYACARVWSRVSVHVRRVALACVCAPPCTDACRALPASSPHGSHVRMHANVCATGLTQGQCVCIGIYALMHSSNDASLHSCSRVHGHAWAYACMRVCVFAC